MDGWLREFIECVCPRDPSRLHVHMLLPPLPLSFRTDLDCNAKFWRLVADIMNDLANFLELLAPLFPAFFLFIVCAASVSKVSPSLGLM